MDFIEEVSNIIEEKRDKFIEVSDKIWEFAEPRFNEVKSSKLISKVLNEEGFDVTEGVCGIETAFSAAYGSGKPKIGILAEYDALYNMSQKANISEKEEILKGECGHGCGHNQLGAGALAAAVAVKEYMIKNNVKGTICLYGCPAEEGGSGKAYMAKGHTFDDLDAVFTWHPDSLTGIMSTSSLANIQVYFKFYGKSAHAAACPHLGRSALDAVELMNIGVNFLREHIIPEARIHYAMTNGGGLSPNVVQANAEVLYLMRAPKMAQVKEIYERVINIAKGAALMTDTRFEITFDSTAANLVMNDTLNKVMYNNLLKVGAVKADESDIEFANKIRETLSEEEKKADAKNLNIDVSKKNISDFIVPYKFSESVMPGSTDVGDVSWIVPTAQCVTACRALGTPGHSWQVVAQGKADLGHKGLLLAGKVIAISAIEVMQNSEIIEKAKGELKERLNGEVYTSVIPEGAKPNK